jgi:prepilin-type N-terminal cleavage/methylation domain-containing protein
MTEHSEPQDKGFTLIELLIVITILGILAAIVVFAVGSTGSNATTSACQADKHTVDVAIEAYKAEHGSYPTDYTSDSPPLVPTYMKEQPPASENITWDSNGSVTSTVC